MICIHPVSIVCSMWARPGQGKFWFTATADHILAFLMAPITTSHLCWLAHGASGHGYPEVRHFHWAAIPPLAAIPRDQCTNALQCGAEDGGAVSALQNRSPPLCLAVLTFPLKQDFCCPCLVTGLSCPMDLINPSTGMNQWKLHGIWVFLTVLLLPTGTWCHPRVLLPSWANEDLFCSSRLW